MYSKILYNELRSKSRKNMGVVEMANTELRKLIKSLKVPKWKIASAIGIADTTFSKWLRHEMNDERRVLVVAAIERLKEGQDNG